jgi:hypothetical protein
VGSGLEVIVCSGLRTIGGGGDWGLEVLDMIVSSGLSNGGDS